MKYCYILHNPMTKENKRVSQDVLHKLFKEQKFSREKINALLRASSKNKPIVIDKIHLYQTKNKHYHKEIKRD